MLLPLFVIAVLCLFSEFWICICPFPPEILYSVIPKSMDILLPMFKIRIFNMDTVLSSNSQSLFKRYHLYQ